MIRCLPYAAAASCAAPAARTAAHTCLQEQHCSQPRPSAAHMTQPYPSQPHLWPAQQLFLSAADAPRCCATRVPALAACGCAQLPAIMLSTRQPGSTAGMLFESGGGKEEAARQLIRAALRTPAPCTRVTAGMCQLPKHRPCCSCPQLPAASTSCSCAARAAAASTHPNIAAWHTSAPSPPHLQVPMTAPERTSPGFAVSRVNMAVPP